MRIWAAVWQRRRASQFVVRGYHHPSAPSTATYPTFMSCLHSWSWRCVVDQHQLGVGVSDFFSVENSLSTRRTWNVLVYLWVNNEDAKSPCSSQEHRVNLHIVKMHASIPLPTGMFSLRTITGEPPFIPNHCEWAPSWYLPAGVRSEGHKPC